MLEFHEDAICLSGITGTKIKSEILNRYYRFWWNITSGGERSNHNYPTAIIELNAGTGEIFIEETSEIIFGSAGHALLLKFELDSQNSLKIILVEEDPECYLHLKNVIKRKFPEFYPNIQQTNNSSNIFLLNCSLVEALERIENIQNLGNALFFFDPLRMTRWQNIENVAKKRVTQYYGTRTEFIIFLFTSDFFLGRKEFTQFPSHNIEEKWTSGEKKSILEADELFENTEWRELILTDKDIFERENEFIALYKRNLQRWFRYVLTLPFNPKKDQIYHLIYCSNYAVGIRATKNNFLSLTKNFKIQPDNKTTYKRFLYLHPELSKSFIGKKQRPLVWKILWAFIVQEDGIRDRLCPDLHELNPDQMEIQRGLDWLAKRRYIEQIDVKSEWYSSIPKYEINWPILYERLRISKPPLMKPLSNEEVMNELKEDKKEQMTFSDFH